MTDRKFRYQVEYLFTGDNIDDMRWIMTVSQHLYCEVKTNAANVEIGTFGKYLFWGIKGLVHLKLTTNDTQNYLQKYFNSTAYKTFMSVYSFF